MKRSNLWITASAVVVLMGIFGITNGYSASMAEGAAETPTLTVMVNSGAAAHHRPASNDLPAYQALEEKSGIHVEWNVIETSNYREVLRARLAAGIDLPDVIDLPSGIGDVYNYALDGLVIPLNDLIAEHAPNLSRWFEEYPIHKASMTSPDGEIYAINHFVLPNTLSKNLMHNMLWLEAVGMDTPETTDDFVELLTAFRDGDPNGNGERDEIPLVPTGKSDINIIGNAFGLHLAMYLPYTVTDGAVSWDYESDRYREYLEYMNLLYREQLLDQEYLTNNSGTTLEKVGNDRVGTVSFWSTWAFVFSRSHPHGTPDGETPIFNVPPPLIGPHGDQYFERRILSGGRGLVITRDAKRPDWAMRWIDFVRNSEEAITIQNWGVEGLTYRVVDGKKEFIPTDEDISLNERLLRIGAGQPPYPHLQVKQAWINRFPGWIFPLDEKLQHYYIEPFPPIASTKEEIDTIDAVRGDLVTYYNEMKDKFIVGQESIDEKWDEYLQTVARLGSDQFVQVYQQKYDRYLDIVGGN